MGKIFNQKSQTEKRKALRKNMTKAEAMLWSEIKGRKIEGCKFRRQFGVGSYVLDFYCPELKLAIEVDGATHLTNRELRYDIHRETEIENYSIHFLRFTNPEIYSDLYNVLEKIKLKIEELKCKTSPKSPPC